MMMPIHINVPTTDWLLSQPISAAKSQKKGWMTIDMRPGMVINESLSYEPDVFATTPLVNIIVSQEQIF
jgi:hypothetical protein